MYVSFLMITDELLMDNLVSLVLYICPEQDGLNHVTDLQQLTLAEIKLGKYFYQL